MRVIDYSSLQLGELLGKGSYGEVYSGKWECEPVAVKKLIGGKLSADTLKNFLEEVEIWRYVPVCLNINCSIFLYTFLEVFLHAM